MEPEQSLPGTIASYPKRQPRVEASAQPPQRSSPAEQSGELSVLLVDDDAALIRSLKAGLEAEGLRVITAMTAAEAMAVLADQRVGLDVLVMDLVLPDSWGSQVGMDRTLYRPDVPVIYISGHARGDPILAASSVGDVAPFLEKPFSASELATLVRRVAHEGAAG